MHPDFLHALSRLPSWRSQDQFYEVALAPRDLTAPLKVHERKLSYIVIKSTHGAQGSNVPNKQVLIRPIFQNVTISVVGTDREFTIYEDESVDTYLQLIAGEERRGGAGGAAEDDAPAAPAAEGGAAAEGDEMDTN